MRRAIMLMSVLIVLARALTWMPYPITLGPYNGISSMYLCYASGTYIPIAISSSAGKLFMFFVNNDTNMINAVNVTLQGDGFDTYLETNSKNCLLAIINSNMTLYLFNITDNPSKIKENTYYILSPSSYTDCGSVALDNGYLYLASSVPNTTDYNKFYIEIYKYEITEDGLRRVLAKRLPLTFTGFCADLKLFPRQGYLGLYVETVSPFAQYYYIISKEGNYLGGGNLNELTHVDAISVYDWANDTMLLSDGSNFYLVKTVSTDPTVLNLGLSCYGIGGEISNDGIYVYCADMGGYLYKLDFEGHVIFSKDLSNVNLPFSSSAYVGYYLYSMRVAENKVALLYEVDYFTQDYQYYNSSFYMALDSLTTSPAQTSQVGIPMVALPALFLRNKKRALVLLLILGAVAFAIRGPLEGVILCPKMKKVVPVTKHLMKMMHVKDLSSLKSIIAMKYSCYPKLVRFHKMNAYLVVNGTANYGWQLDSVHVGVLPIKANLTQLNSSASTVEVAVIDSGLAPGAPVNADWANAKAITSFVDYLISNGECSDYGVANLYGKRFDLILDWLAFLIFGITTPYYMPYNATIYKYCVVPPQDSNDTTVIFVQLTEPYDVVGHGTFVSSMISGNLTLSNGTSYVTGVLPPALFGKVKVVPVKADLIVLYPTSNCTTLSACLNGTVYMDFGYFDDESLAGAASYVSTLHQSLPELKVVNMSLGGWYDSSEYNAFQEACQDEVEPMVNAGLTVVVAAGNEGMLLSSSNGFEFPSMCPGTYPVAALDVNNTLADFSNYGPYLAFAAPGEDVLGIYPTNSVLAKLSEPIANTSNFMVTYDSGTSYASPIAAGIVALAYSIGKNVYAVMNGARDLYAPGFDGYTGYGEVYAPGALVASTQKPSIGLSMENRTALVQSDSLNGVALTLNNQVINTTSTTIITVKGQGVPVPALLALFLPFLRRRKKLVLAIALSAVFIAHALTIERIDNGGVLNVQESQTLSLQTDHFVQSTLVYNNSDYLVLYGYNNVTTLYKLECGGTCKLINVSYVILPSKHTFTPYISSMVLNNTPLVIIDPTGSYTNISIFKIEDDKLTYVGKVSIGYPPTPIQYSDYAVFYIYYFGITTVKLAKFNGTDFNVDDNATSYYLAHVYPYFSDIYNGPILFEDNGTMYAVYLTNGGTVLRVIEFPESFSGETKIIDFNLNITLNEPPQSVKIIANTSNAIAISYDMENGKILLLTGLNSSPTLYILNNISYPEVLAVSADGKVLFSFKWGDEVGLIDPKTGKVYVTLEQLEPIDIDVVRGFIVKDGAVIIKMDPSNPTLYVYHLVPNGSINITLTERDYTTVTVGLRIPGTALVAVIVTSMRRILRRRAFKLSS
ncbi:hypothetical protein IPA_07110 [Ignicoccus pacificus DSM 13166]|uniref:Peptidase S8/S53 domain-containing protein n=1 Tax=Ignicoccus pacificus DSM 13166 TaxID=940294 RepID=A0A977KBN6_9CREN|nr:hypothetical protein IPA_07110 [Ignicoccus pacificus DSM 13166]